MPIPAIALAFALAASGTPMKDGFAYSRETLSGIPGDATSAARSLETTYLIYVVVPKGKAPRDATVWLKGKHHAATLKRVSTPVEVEQDPALPSGKKDTLVPATASAVYQVIPGEEQAPGDDAGRQATNGNDVVVCLRSDGSERRVVIKDIKPLRPAPGR